MKRVLLASAAFVAAATAAHAVDMITYDLGTGNSAISGFPGPYASVEVLLDSPTMATVTFSSDKTNAFIYLMGGVNAVGVNVNAASWTVSGITGSNGFLGFTPGPYSDAGSGNVNGFGVFNQTINSFDGFSNAADTVIFTLTDTSGTWANSASVLSPNAGGNVAEIHAFVASYPPVASNGAITTGFASNGNDVPVPGPVIGAGLPGLILASAGLLGWWRRRWKKIN